MDESNDSEDIVKRHKHERKELQAHIQSLKRNVNKCDRRRKKETQQEITRLEQELLRKHSSELLDVVGDAVLVEKPDKPPPPQLLLQDNKQTEDEDEEIDVTTVTEPLVAIHQRDDSKVRVSRAQRRRNNRRRQDEKQQQENIANDDHTDVIYEGIRTAELSKIQNRLQEYGLSLYDVPADGNCLYCSVRHQLETTGRQTYSVNQLRKLTAEYIRTHCEEFIPFMYDSNTADDDDSTAISAEYFQEFCRQIEKTKAWGGQLEIKALSNALSCPIKVIQADAPPTVQGGDAFLGPELILTYHRHLYRLGEHYNSTVRLPSNNNISCRPTNNDDALDGDDDPDESEDVDVVM